MSGMTDLARLLASLRPTLAQGEFVFLSFAGAVYGDESELEPVASFREDEGLTLIVPRARADAAGLAYDAVFRMITLGVHSSLIAVGLTAAVAQCLAERGISANVVAAFHHDHVFVPSEVAVPALEALLGLSGEAS